MIQVRLTILEPSDYLEKVPPGEISKAHIAEQDSDLVIRGSDLLKNRRGPEVLKQIHLALLPHVTSAAAKPASPKVGPGAVLPDGGLVLSGCEVHLHAVHVHLGHAGAAK